MTGIAGAGGENILAVCDNADLMKKLLYADGMEGKIDLIYIDPPFYSKSDYGSEIRLNSDQGVRLPSVRHTVYQDTWENGMEEYLSMLAFRFYLMKDLLSETGSLFVHLDWHVVHYVKVLLDEIFGEKNFVNEIVWHYKSGGVSKRYYARKHDTLLFYAKGSKYYFSPQSEKSYNRGHKPYRFKGVREYRDDLGWYTMVNMKDVWTIDMVGRTAAERTGYATQKPEALISRILEGSTREGHLAADFFAGSGTLAAVAERMGRRWISCDIGKSAAGKAAKRLSAVGASYRIFETPDSSYGGSLTIGIATKPHEVAEGMAVCVAIRDYSIDNIGDLPTDDRHKETVRLAEASEPLQLLDYWSVDFDYDGMIYKPEELRCRQNGKLDTEITKDGADFRCIAVRAVDVFGNSSFKVLKRTGDDWL